MGLIKIERRNTLTVLNRPEHSENVTFFIATLRIKTPTNQILEIILVRNSYPIT